MFRFRLFIFKDPDAHDRGYSLKGIKVPLTTFCPVAASPTMISYDGSSSYGPHTEYWPIPTSLLVLARPALSRHLRGIDKLLVPTDWVDVAPYIGHFDVKEENQR
jgi:hypothetical protein